MQNLIITILTLWDVNTFGQTKVVHFSVVQRVVTEGK